MKINFKKLLLFVIIIATIALTAILVKLDAPPAEPTVSPAPEPTQSAVVPEENPVLSRADEILAGMTLREKLYQMFIVTPDMLAGETGVKSMTPALKEGLETFPVGGIIYMGEMFQVQSRLKRLFPKLQRFLKYLCLFLWIRKAAELQD